MLLMNLCVNLYPTHAFFSVIYSTEFTEMLVKYHMQCCISSLTDEKYVNVVKYQEIELFDSIASRCIKYYPKVIMKVVFEL